MNSAEFAKQCKVIEIQLNQAAQLLSDPNRFVLPELELSQYREYADNREFELAMDELAEFASEFGCRSGFWRRLKEPAIQMGLTRKADEYEVLFQEALARED